jgi:DNA primase catalytic subunit
MADERRDTDVLGAPLGSMERTLMVEYLRSRGVEPEDLDRLPAEEQERLRREAALHASAKLEQIEEQARFVHRFHEAGGTSHTAGD